MFDVFKMIGVFDIIFVLVMVSGKVGVVVVWLFGVGIYDVVKVLFGEMFVLCVV